MSPPNRKIVKIPSKDADKVYPVHAASFSRDAVDFLSPESFKSLVEGRGATLLTANSCENGDTEPAAYILYRQIGAEAELLSLATQPDARQKGLAGALVAEMLTDLRKNRVESVFLEVESTNNDAIGVYEHLGFAHCGTRKAYYGNKKDAFVMKSSLC